MKDMDVLFTGSVPANYDRYLVPLLFRPYAAELARRAATFSPDHILETAAGTGVVTKELHEQLPAATIMATDLNRAMLDVASERIHSDRVRFQEADALNLPFADQCFDLAVCQFGVMFYPNKVRGNSEARRVLGDGGRYMVTILDRIERNPLSETVQQVLLDLFPDDPPMFLRRGPISYANELQIESDLEAAGFGEIQIETVELRSRSPSAHDAAMALCYGSPMRVEVEDRRPDALDRIFEAVERAFRSFETADGINTPMSAHIVTATA